MEKVEFACLIAPTWPGQVWYPQLVKMLMKTNPTPMQEDLTLSLVQAPHPLILQG